MKLALATCNALKRSRMSSRRSSLLGSSRHRLAAVELAPPGELARGEVAPPGRSLPGEPGASASCAPASCYRSSSSASGCARAAPPPRVEEEDAGMSKGAAHAMEGARQASGSGLDRIGAVVDEK